MIPVVIKKGGINVDTAFFNVCNNPYGFIDNNPDPIQTLPTT